MTKQLKGLVERYFKAMQDRNNRYNEGLSQGLYQALCIMTRDNESLTKEVADEIERLTEKSY